MQTEQTTAWNRECVICGHKWQGSETDACPVCAQSQTPDIDAAKQRIEDAARGVRARSEATDHRGDFFAQVKTAEMAQKIARRLGKPQGVFSDFAVRWIEAVDALEQELKVHNGR